MREERYTAIHSWRAVRLRTLQRRTHLVSILDPVVEIGELVVHLKVLALDLRVEVVLHQVAREAAVSVRLTR